MSHDPIEQTLRDEPEITPSVEFSRRVMRSVRQEADENAAFPFPWRRLVAGLAVSAALTLAAVVLGDPAPIAAPAGPPSPMAAGVAWLTSILIACFGAAWWSVRSARD